MDDRRAWTRNDWRKGKRHDLEAKERGLDERLNISMLFYFSSRGDYRSLTSDSGPISYKEVFHPRRERILTILRKLEMYHALGCCLAWGTRKRFDYLIFRPLMAMEKEKLHYVERLERWKHWEMGVMGWLSPLFLFDTCRCLHDSLPYSEAKMLALSFKEFFNLCLYGDGHSHRMCASVMFVACLSASKMLIYTNLRA